MNRIAIIDSERAHRLERNKFADPYITADGHQRASVALEALRTLWINTGTLCNLTCSHCYIESSPTNDRLVYITAGEVAVFFDEIAAQRMPTELIGFTGGEPFMNPEIDTMLGDALERGFSVLVLTNAMKPMWRHKPALLALKDRYGDALTLRVSIDHHGATIHELERGERSWAPALQGLRWLAENGFKLAVAGRTFTGEAETVMRAGYGRLFAANDIALDAGDPAALVLLPEMDAELDVPEITTACWDLLKVDPSSVMCAHERMVVKRKGAASPVVLPCTLLPYDERFELGRTLAQSAGAVSLNHPHCARFCVLGGGSCSGE
ncbi:MAG: radical SAM protein [Alphaproteobacteria bacterium]|nr:radical SAM protein [Alphaproteobacteria bacterium]